MSPASLSPEQKRAQLAELLRRKSQPAPEIHPLSPGQQSLWVLSQLSPDNVSYNLMAAAQLPASVDFNALSRAFERLVDRHPLLRCRVSLENGKPLQTFPTEFRPRIETLDGSMLTDEELRRAIELSADQPFDFNREPLFRIRFYQRLGTSPVLLLVAHHVALDFWSLDVLLDELARFYAVEVGIATEIPEPPTARYVEFVQEQRALANSDSGAAQWKYWEQALAGAPHQLNLATDRPRPPMQTYKGAAYAFEIPAETARRIRERAASLGATPYVLILSTYQALLHRYTGQDDFLVGTPMAGRNRREYERVVGHFVNPVAIRSDFSGNPTFVDLLNATRRRVAEAVDHQDFPFGLIAERLQATRDPSRTPLYQASFVWDRSRQSRINTTETHKPGSLILEPFLWGQRGAPFDITFTVIDLGDALRASFQYNTDLFDGSTLERMAGHFRILLQSVLEDPSRRISDLPLLSNAERQLIVTDWNSTAADYPRDSTTQELFEQIAREHPDRPAVEYGEELWTFARLNTRANQVARLLVDKGAGADVIVALCMRRTPDLLAAFLGVLKAGAAYVPLDPDFPADRIAFMLEDTAAPVILTESSLAESLPESSADIVILDQCEPLLATYSDENLETRSGPDNLAYVIFTSGSTGKPKGAQITHRGLVNYLFWAINEYRVSEGAGAPLHSPIGFDLTVTSIFAPLLGGRPVILVPESARLEILARTMLAHDEFSFVKVTPAHLKVLAHTLPNDQLAGRAQALIIGGEALYAENVAAWRKHAPATRLVNEYGPTETVVGCCVHEVRPDDPETGSIPIGRPIANTQLYVLDKYGNVAPIGVVGELYIGGDGVARGYLNRPELTSERFLPDPFRNEPAARLYRTGDLARYRPDGILEYLGRIDHQVKIRGYRIELEEIESVLSEHPSVKECVVVAIGEGVSEKRLATYIVPHAQNGIAVADLRSYLKESLPDYMVPAAFVMLASLPLTSHGKVDRKALPIPTGDRPDLEARYIAPESDLQKLLVEVWQAVLGIERIGIEDHFFDLGGASIQSLEVAARLQDAGWSLTADLIFQFPTIAELAPQLEARRAESVLPAPAPMIPSATKAARTESTSENIFESSTSRTKIESLGVYLPERVVTTEEVLQGCKVPISFPLEKMTGIRSRRWVAEGEYAVDLSLKAAADCLSRSRFKPDEIDLVICCNISRHDGPKQFSFEPGTAIRVRDKLGLTNALCFDVSNACAGFFTGIWIADGFLRSGAARNALIVSGEHITHLIETAQKEIESFLDPKLACLTVGDAGAAVVLERSADSDVGFEDLDLFTLGDYSDLCIAKATDREHGGAIMVTDSIRQTAVAIRHSVNHACEVLRRKRWGPESVDQVLLHQTSETALRDAGREINSAYQATVCSETNLILNLTERGNTASTSHFVALADRIREGRVTSGDRIVFGITGSGQTIGTALYRLDDLPDRMRDNAKQPSLPALRKPSIDRRTTARIASWGMTPETIPFRRDATELARLAAENCLANNSVARESIDLLLYTGVYRNDFLCEPAIAALLAGKLQINASTWNPGEPSTFALDLLNGPLGFLNACHVASELIESGKRSTVMIAASEIENNALVHPEQLRGLVETGSALLLEQAPAGGSGFLSFRFASFPEYIDLLRTQSTWKPGKTWLEIDHNEGYERALLDLIPEVVSQYLDCEDIPLAGIDAVVLPHISSDFVESLRSRMKLSSDQTVRLGIGDRDYFTSSIVGSLNVLSQSDRTQPDTWILMVSAAAGVQIGCALYRF